MICFSFLTASSVPRNLMIVGSPGRTNITVQWTEPALPNGNISSYKVRHISYFYSKAPTFHSKTLILHSKILMFMFIFHSPYSIPNAHILFQAACAPFH